MRQLIFRNDNEMDIYFNQMKEELERGIYNKYNIIIDDISGLNDLADLDDTWELLNDKNNYDEIIDTFKGIIYFCSRFNIKQDYEKSYKHLIKHENPYSKPLLAVMHKTGWGTEVDSERAHEDLRWCAVHGNEKMIEILANKFLSDDDMESVIEILQFSNKSDSVIVLANDAVEKGDLKEGFLRYKKAYEMNLTNSEEKYNIKILDCCRRNMTKIMDSIRDELTPEEYTDFTTFTRDDLLVKLSL